MSEAYASTLHISFDVRGGLIIRQIHHWAALIFVAAMVVHMGRVFFTGAFRKPRETNWLIGVVLLDAELHRGPCGLLAARRPALRHRAPHHRGRAARRCPWSAPTCRSSSSAAQFPGEDIIPRLYTVHVLLIPGIFLALITVHLMLVWYQKHTQYPLPGRTEKNAVGYPFFPVYTAKAGGFFFITFGVTTLLSAFVVDQPGLAVRAVQPGRDLGRLAAGLVHGLPRGRAADVPELGDPPARASRSRWNVLGPALIIPGLLFTPMAIYPFLERWVTGDNARAPRPRPAAQRPDPHRARRAWRSRPG